VYHLGGLFQPPGGFIGIYAPGPRAEWEVDVAATFNREQIRSALGASDAAYSYYLDLESGEVVRVPDAEDTPEAEALRNKVMEGYGDRFRYIPGGNSSPSEADVQTWMDAEGL
jgi:predicted exporter